MGSAVFAGHRRGDIRAVAVATDAPEPSSPCGMCRQFLREFCGEGVPVVMVGRDGAQGRVLVRTVGEVSWDSLGGKWGKGVEQGLMG